MPTPSWYPMYSVEQPQDAFVLQLANSFLVLRRLFEEAGIRLVDCVKTAGVAEKNDDERDAAAGGRLKAKREHTVVEISSIISVSRMHIPGGIMTLVDAMRIPTTRGFKHVSRAQVNECFDAVPLTDLEPRDFLSHHSYRELDVMRFAFVAVAKHFVEKGLLDASGNLTPLARRDLKANCREFFAEDEAGVGSSACSAPAPQRHVKTMLLEECSRRWPHTPATKAAVISTTSDPTRPRHQPLYQSTVELTLAKKKFGGQWCPRKADAENDACAEALKFLYSKGSVE